MRRTVLPQAIFIVKIRHVQFPSHSAHDLQRRSRLFAASRKSVRSDGEVVCPHADASISQTHGKERVRIVDDSKS
jgi:hypothetical protein